MRAFAAGVVEGAGGASRSAAAASGELLQALVRAGILKSVRGPAGGYELARERRRLNVGEIVRVALRAEEEGIDGEGPALLARGLSRMIADAERQALAKLDYDHLGRAAWAGRRRGLRRDRAERRRLRNLSARSARAMAGVMHGVATRPERAQRPRLAE